MALSFVVVCEARADFETASDLADRVICELIDWIEPEMLHHHRRTTDTRTMSRSSRGDG